MSSSFRHLRYKAQGFVSQWGELIPVAALLATLVFKVSCFSFPMWYDEELNWTGASIVEVVRVLLSSAATLLLLFAALPLLPQRARLVGAWTLNLVLTLVVLSDVVHLRFFGDVISVVSLAAGGQIRDVSDSIAQLLRLGDGIFFADLVLVPMVVWLRGRREITANSSQLSFAMRRVVARNLALTGLLLVALPAGNVVVDQDRTFRYSYLRLFGVRKIGLLNFHAYEAGRRFATGLHAKHDASPEERVQVEASLRDWRRQAMAPSDLAGVARGRNVIFVLMESFQAFPVGLRINGQEVTPTLNSLAGRSLVWQNFYSQAWDGKTSDGEFTSLQGLHPLAEGAAATTFPYNTYRGLPAILRERGYSTLSAHAYYGDLWNMRRMHPSLGFERSLFREQFQENEDVGMGMPDSAFFAQTVPKLERLSRPFMAYLMTLTTHHPYVLPAKYKRLRLGDFEGTVLGDYLHTIHYLDGALAGLLRDLESRGLLQQSMLVLYGDHSTNLGPPADLERLLRTHAGYAPRERGWDPRYWRAENRLPLMMYLPGSRTAGVRTAAAGHLDISPTVLGLLGVRDHRMTSLGRDVSREDVPGPVVLRNGAFVQGDTVCVPPGLWATETQCGDVHSGAHLEPVRFAEGFRQARKRLDLSDQILRGNLIPGAATTRAVASAKAD